jgi:hypothetical protein
MKRIDENQLAARVASLKEKMAEIENAQFDEGIGSTIWNGVKGAGKAIGNALNTTGGKLAAGTALVGAGTVAAQTLAGNQNGQAGATTGTTTKVPGKSDPAILKQQQDLIAKGAKIKADGIMGPATQAAIKQFGGQAAAPAAAPTGTTPPAAPAAPTSTQVQTDDEGNHMITTPDGKTVVVGADGKPLPNGGKVTPTPTAPTGSAALAPAADGSNAATAIPSGPQTVPGQQGSAALNPAVNGDKATSIPSGPATAAGAPAAAPAAAAPVDTTDPLAANNAQSVGAAPTATAGTPPPPAVKAESVGFQNDELNRIISLVHHR